MTFAELHRVSSALRACDDVQEWLETLSATPDLTHEGHHCAEVALQAVRIARLNLVDLTKTPA
jgi:hypothetical protein